MEDLETQGADSAATGEEGTQHQTQQQNQQQAQQDQKWYPDDWRQKLTSDPKVQKRLERFKEPDGVLKWALEADRKISSGEFKQAALPENPTPEQLKQWRADHGIPESVEGYDIKVDEGLYTENDKPYLDSLYKFALDKNLPKSTVEGFVNFLFTSRKEAADLLAERDNQDKQTTEEALRSKMGNEYKVNINAMMGMMDGVNEEVRKNFLEARLPDGTKLINSPEVVEMLVGFAREINPAATVLPSGGGANTLKSIEEEIAEIEKYISTNRDEYFKDKKKQARYFELIDAQKKLKDRGK